jgi:hypothetical protein
VAALAWGKGAITSAIESNVESVCLTMNWEYKANLNKPRD